MITYHSTRGSKSTLSFQDIVLSGVAEDKGLYLPNGTTLKNLSNLTQEDLSYEDFVKTIFIALDKNSASYIDELSIYPGFEKSPEPVLREIKKDKYVMELFHGPTKSFKDYALQPLGATVGMVSFGSRVPLEINLVSTSLRFDAQNISFIESPLLLPNQAE